MKKCPRWTKVRETRGDGCESRSGGDLHAEREARLESHQVKSPKMRHLIS